MLTGREREAMLLRSPGEHPAKGITRNIIYGTGFAVILTLFFIGTHGTGWKSIIAFMIVGNALSFFGWGTERLWYATVSKMMKDPFSLTAYCSRIPFWYMAGGIAYALSMLMVKKIGLMEVYDIPVKELFDAGGRIGCAVQIPLQIMLNRKLNAQSPAVNIAVK